MAKLSALLCYLERDARAMRSRLRALPDALDERLRAHFGDYGGEQVLDDADACWTTPQVDLNRHWPGLRRWYIAELDVAVGWVADLRHLRVASRQMRVALPPYFPSLGQALWCRQRLWLRDYWLFLGADDWEGDDSDNDETVFFGIDGTVTIMP